MLDVVDPDVCLLLILIPGKTGQKSAVKRPVQRRNIVGTLGQHHLFSFYCLHIKPALPVLLMLISLERVGNAGNFAVVAGSLHTGNPFYPEDILQVRRYGFRLHFSLRCSYVKSEKQEKTCTQHNSHPSVFSAHVPLPLFPGENL